jgi:hypothetical protein
MLSRDLRKYEHLSEINKTEHSIKNINNREELTKPCFKERFSEKNSYTQYNQDIYQDKSKKDRIKIILEETKYAIAFEAIESHIDFQEEKRVIPRKRILVGLTKQKILEKDSIISGKTTEISKEKENSREWKYYANLSLYFDSKPKMLLATLFQHINSEFTPVFDKITKLPIESILFIANEEQNLNNHQSTNNNL